MFRDSIIAAVRTAVAALVGVIVVWLFNVGVEVPSNFEESLNGVLVAVVTLGYNLGVGLLERKVNPLFGIMLGIPKAPAYGKVGTQTPPPADPLVGNPPVDRA